ncbi:GH116 family glycosyl hydrolase [Vibrio sp. WJH972]
MTNKIPYTSYLGKSEALCSKGNAVEFIQPWYVPISTTPENTGMAVGGIGNTFTLTPEGKTPNFSFIPGIFIDCEHEDIHFNDFYCSVMDDISLDNLEILDADELASFLKFYPADLGFDCSAISSKEAWLTNIQHSLKSGEFYLNNQRAFARWNVEFTAKTQREISVNPKSMQTQLLVALDFFNGLLVNASARSLSLTAGNRHSRIDSISANQIDYRALYPIAEYEYQAFETVKITRNVISPVVKDDQKRCSLPLHWNHFSMVNQSEKTQLVTLVQPLRNLIGSTYQKARDGIQDSCCHLVQNPIAQRHCKVEIGGEEFQFSGVSLSSQSRYGADIEGEVVYGVHADAQSVFSNTVTVSMKSQLYASHTQQQVERALKTGRTNDHFDHGIYSGRESLSALVCVQIELQAGESIELRFAQVMDHSKISLNGWASEKAYSRYYSGNKRAKAILEDVLPQLESIEERIISQQSEFRLQAEAAFEHSDSSARYATMAMNSLSFLAESTVWDKENKFLVKECVDYPFFNSLDVYFYGSFSLLYLLPELDGCVMTHFAEAILASDDTVRRYWEYEDKPNAELVDQKYQGTRAIEGAVIHDLGSPYDIQPDAYSWHNVKEWKDLAPKYILMVYRHWQKTGNLDVVTQCWPAVQASIRFLNGLIEEGDTLPLTRGTDDTFDNLSSHGVSIYCGSLWAAGLKAASELASLLNEPTLALGFSERSVQAIATVERGLWDEKNGYYHFFITPIQAKHLTGIDYQLLEPLGLTLSGETIADASLLNQFLDDVDLTSSVPKSQQRAEKKQTLLSLAPNAFSDEFTKLVPDSDNSFGDALLADSYLKLVGLEGLFPEERIDRTLDFIYRTNFEINSPKLGVANMTLADGQPHEAFQAQDVWIGVQFSAATALRFAGKQQQAERLIDTVYHALYGMAKIPFAAPEGFNCSVAVTQASLAEQFQLTSAVASDWYNDLIKVGYLLGDGRVNPELTSDISTFKCQLEASRVIEESVMLDLNKWLLSTGLKYTAGRYFRPGMIFAYLYESL